MLSATRHPASGPLPEWYTLERVRRRATAIRSPARGFPAACSCSACPTGGRTRTRQGRRRGTTPQMKDTAGMFGLTRLTPTQILVLVGVAILFMYVSGGSLLLGLVREPERFEIGR